MKKYIYVLFFVCLTIGCFAEGRSLSFPEVGKSYRIEFIAQSTVNDKNVYYTGSIENGSIVKILDRSDSGWCLVESVHRVGLDPKSQAPVFRKQRLWLNFSVLFLATQVDERKIPSNAIVQ